MNLLTERAMMNLMNSPEPSTAQDTERAMAEWREAADEHFYGAWKGGSAASGGHPAGGGGGTHHIEASPSSDKGSHDPLNLDHTGSPWRDASGAHSTGWGPRGQLNAKGEEMLPRKLYGKNERYAVPRGFHDVHSVGSYGNSGKGPSYNGDGVAWAKPAKDGTQRMRVRVDGQEHDIVVGGGKARADVHTASGERLGSINEFGGKWRVRDRMDEADRSQSFPMVENTRAMAVERMVQGWQIAVKGGTWPK